jgi:hypothetical protein
VKKVLKTSGKLAVATVAAGVSVLFAGVRFLAGAAETTPADDELSSSVRGGLLNYRTGKFDDGTDPAGFY